MVAIIIVITGELGTLQLRKSRCTTVQQLPTPRPVEVSWRAVAAAFTQELQVSAVTNRNSGRAGAGAWRRPTSDRSESSGVTRTPPLCAGSRSEPREIKSQLSSCRLHLLINLFISLFVVDCYDNFLYYPLSLSKQHTTSGLNVQLHHCISRACLYSTSMSTYFTILLLLHS